MTARTTRERSARKIFKYTLNMSNSPLDMPIDAHVLKVAAQGHTICLWAVVYPDRKTELRRFVVVPTGGDYPKGNPEYIDTAIFENTCEVWHVFECDL
jgi:hypothetical protein